MDARELWWWRLGSLITNRDTFRPADMGITLDPEHRINSGQNGLGGLWSQASRRGYIRKVGDAMQHHDHRKGGRAQVWAGTVEGHRWAREHLARYPGFNGWDGDTAAESDQLELFS